MRTLLYTHGVKNGQRLHEKTIDFDSFIYVAHCN